jgi:hypothetical protein
VKFLNKATFNAVVEKCHINVTVAGVDVELQFVSYAPVIDENRCVERMRRINCILHMAYASVLESI